MLYSILNYHIALRSLSNLILVMNKKQYTLDLERI